MEIKFLKPIGGAKIRDPKTKEFLSQDGRRVEMSVYWNRRVKDGTVAIVENQPAFPKIEKSPADKYAAEKSTEKSAKRGNEL